MIGVTLDGRLGNQLFQYAFAISTARKFGTRYFIENERRTDMVKKYFNVNSILNNRISRIFYRRFIVGKLSNFNQNESEKVSDLLPLIRNHQHYKGFFQSELFFHEIGKEVHQHFPIRSRYQKVFEKKYSSLFSKKVLAIHFRLGDYLTWGNELYGGPDMTLPDSYYINALAQIPDLKDYTILVVSDDAENAANKLCWLKHKCIISDNEIMDFQLLMHADKLIISNSSFAWWAAFLNVKNAEVFAPDKWLGFKVAVEMPDKVLPGKFKRVRVEAKELTIRSVTGKK